VKGKTMSVYSKLNEARISLQNTELSKSGHNKFAGYRYFELGDFLPAIQDIFRNLNLCGVVSYTAEYATLTIVDIDDKRQYADNKNMIDPIQAAYNEMKAKFNETSESAAG
jgi:hypothetical protein